MFLCLIWLDSVVIILSNNSSIIFLLISCSLLESSVYDMATITSWEDLVKARDVIKSSPHVNRTPLVKMPTSLLPGVSLYAKLENMQTVGSFKIRGVINVMENASDEVLSGDRKLFTISSGNYGKALAYFWQKKNLTGKIILPSTAPKCRIGILEGYGCEVELCPTEELSAAIDRHMKEQRIFLHPFDDIDLIAGYGSVGMEILEDCPSPDFIVVCCGGGSLVSGISAAVRLSGQSPDTKIIAVEPVTANTMYLSLQEGHAVKNGAAKSIAGGLAPPFVGEKTYAHVKKFVDDVVLVTDEEIAESVNILFHSGLVVEPSGTAAFTAVRCGKISGIEGKKVVVVITGGNISPEELTTFVKL